MARLIYILFILFPSLLSSQELTGRIVKVSDGDTVVLLDSTNTQHKIRLWGVDCPEGGQDYGNKATQHTKELCSTKYVTVQVKGTDQYKRVLGIIIVDNTGVNVNESLLINGFAWVYKYTKYKPYLKLQEEAQIKKINLWSHPNPIDPHQWRKEQKNKKNAAK